MNGSVVSNTGPIIALSTIGKLEILQQIFHEVVIPERVHQEILAGGRELAGVKSYQKASWIKVEAPKTPLDPLLETILDSGEASVIHLCRERHADFALIDEKSQKDC